MGGSFRRAGYEYCYGFKTDDNIFFEYGANEDFELLGLFEIRCNFKLKNSVGDGDSLMGSESFCHFFPKIADEEDYQVWAETKLGHRLEDYQMRGYEIRTLVHDALDFYKQQRITMTAPARVPVVVELDVFTVQEEGEAIDAAIERAVRPENMFPLILCKVGCKANDRRLWLYGFIEHECVYERDTFLTRLKRITVEEDDDHMCAICSRKCCVGSRISFIPDCNEACHSLCLFKWLYEMNDYCPSCGIGISTNFEFLESDEYQEQLVSELKFRLKLLGFLPKN